MTAQFNPSGTVTGVNDVPGLPQALADLHAATDAVAASLAAFRQSPLEVGFSYAPDASYTVGTDPGVTFGPGASPAGAAFGIPTKVHRWGSVIVIENAIQFDSVDLNGYAWWNDALIRLPAAWFPGVPDNGGLLPPMSGARLEISLLDSAGTTKQVDPYAEVAIGKGNSGATGVIMRSDHFGGTSTVFAPGDFLTFTPSATGFFVLPNGADFT